MKKADISIEMIIKIVLVLVIVGVLLYLFTDRFSVFQQSNNCEERGGICTRECEGETILLGGCEKEEVCCLGLT